MKVAIAEDLGETAPGLLCAVSVPLPIKRCNSHSEGAAKIH